MSIFQKVNEIIHVTMTKFFRGKKRFSQVPFNYGTGITKAKQVCNDDETIAFTAAGHLIPSSADFTKIINKPKKKQVSKAPKMELVDEKEVLWFFPFSIFQLVILSIPILSRFSNLVSTTPFLIHLLYCSPFPILLQSYFSIHLCIHSSKFSHS